MIQFLTFQTLVLIFLKSFFNIEFVNLHLLTFIVLVGGFYLTYVKEFIVFMNKDLSGISLQLSNILIHFLPFLYVWKTFDVHKNYIIETITMFTVYIYVFKPKKVYYIKDKEMLRLYGLFFVILVLFYTIV